MFISPAYAQSAGGGGGFDLIGLMPLLLIFVIFWFFLIRPQQRKQKEHRAMVQSLKRNDLVLTSGGIYGKITRVIDDVTVQVEIADNVRVRMARATIAEVLSRTDARPAARPAEAKKEAKEEEPLPAEPAEEVETPVPPAANQGEATGRKSLFSFGSKK
jgi:preprotein translocase subunit YajC